MSGINPTGVEMSGSMLTSAVNEIAQKDSSAELSHQKQKAADESVVRKGQHDRVALLMEQARELQAKAEKQMEDAKNQGKLSKMNPFGENHAKSAAKTQHQAEELQSLASKAQLLAKVAAEEASNAIEKIQNSLNALEQAKDDVQNMQDGQDRLSQDTLRLAD